MRTYKFYIGIDCGVNTGVCAWNKPGQNIAFLDTVMIHEAMELVRGWNLKYPDSIFVRVEDARLRKWFGKDSNAKMQGAGSVKRDAKIWEDFLTAEKIPFEMVSPKNNKTKLTADRFRMIAGYTKRVSEHARDSAMLVINF